MTLANKNIVVDFDEMARSVAATLSAGPTLRITPKLLQLLRDVDAGIVFYDQSLGIARRRSTRSSRRWSIVNSQDIGQLALAGWVNVDDVNWRIDAVPYVLSDSGRAVVASYQATGQS